MEDNAQKKCLHCKMVFSPGTRANFCNRSCYANYYSRLAREKIQEERKEQPCEYCQTMFKPKTRKATRFCSNICLINCRAESLRPKHDPRDCSNCGEEFKPRRAFQIYCGDKCRNQSALIKRSYGMSAQEFNSLQAPVTPEQRAAQLFPQNQSLQLPSGVIIRPDESLNPCARCVVRKVRSVNDDYCLPCIKEQGLE